MKAPVIPKLLVDEIRWMPPQQPEWPKKDENGNTLWYYQEWTGKEWIRV